MITTTGIGTTTFTFDDEDVDTIVPSGVVVGNEPQRVVQIDFESEELLVVRESDYAARDFSRARRVPFSEALWMVP